MSTCLNILQSELTKVNQRKTVLYSISTGIHHDIKKIDRVDSMGREPNLSFKSLFKPQQ